MGCRAWISRLGDVCRRWNSAVAPGPARPRTRAHCFMSRVDALTTRVEKLEAKHKADEAERQKFDEEPELPPDFDRPQDLPPTPIGDDETHTPGGELHDLPPKDEELPEPPLEIEDAGGVPLSYGNVPTSYVGGGPKDAAGDLPKELEQDLPEPPPEPKGSVYPQPIAVSLNKE